MRGISLSVIALLAGLIPSVASAQDVIPHNEVITATSPLPSGSCMYIDQGPGTNAKLCSGYAAYFSALAIANNLSDLGNVATSRTNLGLGTGNSPTFTGATLSGITGSTQCLQVNSSGLISGTGAVCGSGGGGSGTVASSAIGTIPVYTGATTVTGSPNFTFSSGLLVLNTNASSTFPAFAAGQSTFTILGPDTAQTRVGLQTFGNIAGSSFFVGAAAGTAGSPTPLASGSTAGAYQFAGYDGAFFVHGGRIRGQATQTYSTTQHGMSMIFSTTPSTASAPLTDALTIGDDQNITVAGQAGSGVRCIHVDATGKQSPASGDCATGGSGSVTSLSQGTGMSFSANPITTTGTINLANTAVTPGSYTSTNLTVDAQGRITAAANGSGGGGTATLSYGTIAGGPTAYTLAPTPAVTSNVANYSVVASIPASVAKNTGAATLAVGSAGALPIQINTINGGLALAGGEIVGNDIGGGETQVLLKLNAGATAWVMIGRPGGGTTVNPIAHAITQSEWANGQIFLCTSACSLTMPNLATTTLSSNAGPTVVTVGFLATLTTLGTDVVNTGQPGASAGPGTFIVPADTTAPLFTSGTAGPTAYSTPVGPIQYFSLTFYTGQTLAAAASFGSVATPRTVVGIKCRVDTPSGVSGTVDVYTAVSGVALSSGTKLNTTACNLNGTANTVQDMGIASASIPVNYQVGFVPSGSIADGGTQLLQVNFR